MVGGKSKKVEVTMSTPPGNYTCILRTMSIKETRIVVHAKAYTQFTTNGHAYTLER